MFICSSIWAQEFTFYDSVTAKVLANHKVVLKQENTIRCVKAPCPSNEMSSESQTDASGNFKLTDETILDMRDYIYVVPVGYHSQRFTSMKQKDIHFVPKSITKDFREIKFIDRWEKKPIANQKVWFATTKDCPKAKCTGIVFEGTTNKFGLVYYKFLEVFPKGLSQMDPVYINIEGYSPYVRHHHHRGEAIMETDDF